MKTQKQKVGELEALVMRVGRLLRASQDAAAAGDRTLADAYVRRAVRDLELTGTGGES